MSEVIARLFEPWSRGVFPTAKRRRGPTPLRQVPLMARHFESFRPAVAFGRSCPVGPSGEHRELFQPYGRTEFERWERVENRARRRRRREAWLAAYGVGVGEVG